MPQHATATSFQVGNRGGPGRPKRDVALATARDVQRDVDRNVRQVMLDRPQLIDRALGETLRQDSRHNHVDSATINITTADSAGNGLFVRCGLKF
jgi:hypothetical protein